MFNILICFLLLIVSVAIIFLLAPVEDENKPLDELERQIFKKRARIISVLLFVMSILFIAIDQAELASCITISIVVSVIMLILGKIKN